jgi:hypothetical protein
LRFALLLERFCALAGVPEVTLTWERLFEPVQELRDRIDLVVVLSLREHHHLVEVFCKPRGRLGDADETVLDQCALRVPAHDLVDGRLVVGDTIETIGDQLLADMKDVSFVSVTQQFNTTTSMGRLTLNVS